MKTNNKNKKVPSFDPLTINNKLLHQSDAEKYLGLVLDDKLTWRAHIEHLQSKITSLAGALRRSTRCIPYKIRTIIYNSLVKPLLEYLIEVWGSAYQTNLKDLQITQNKLLKSLFQLDYRFPTKELYIKTNTLSLSQLYKYKTCILIRKILTEAIHTQITFKTKSHLNTRNKHKLQLPMTRTKFGKGTIQFEGAQLYNSLPKEIFCEKSFLVFKEKLKKHCEKL